MEDSNNIKVHFCVPKLGTQIVLAEHWSFDLYYEHRNYKLIEALNIDLGDSNYTMYYNSKHYNKVIKRVAFPKGTSLKIDRIYIRKGASDYDSITFRTIDVPKHEHLNKKRFWAKLDQVNQIICYPIGSKVEIEKDFGIITLEYAEDFSFIDLE